MVSDQETNFHSSVSWATISVVPTFRVLPSTETAVPYSAVTGDSSKVMSSTLETAVTVYFCFAKVAVQVTSPVTAPSVSPPATAQVPSWYLEATDSSGSARRVIAAWPSPMVRVLPSAEIAVPHSTS